MSLDLIPLPVKLAVLAGFTLVVGGASWYARGVMSDNEVFKINANHQIALDAATQAKDAAEAHSLELEKQHSTALAAAATTYEEGRQNDKAQTDRRIADLTGRVTSLLVSAHRVAASSGALPGTPACASSGDGEAVQTLSPTVAGRLARRYAEYNEIVDQLTFCQATLLIDRLQ